MTESKTRHPLADLAAGLKFDYAELGILIDIVGQQTSAYDFFCHLATQVIPYVRKNPAFKTLVDRWDRQSREYRRKQATLQTEAVKEVTAAVNCLDKRLKKINKLKTPAVVKNLNDAKAYLDGSKATYMPPHYECAADALATTCSLLLENDHHQILEDLAEIISIRKSQKINGSWQAVDVPCIKKCCFYEAITTIKRQQEIWRWNAFENTFVCWSYLRLAEQCWNLTEDEFKEETLKQDTIEECQQSAKLLGLHGYWVELQAIKNQRSYDPHFFTTERFKKYLVPVIIQILCDQKKDASNYSLLQITELSLSLEGEHLVLTTYGHRIQDEKQYVLHFFNSSFSPFTFLENLLDHPGQDFSPLDFDMESHSCAGILDRTGLQGGLRKLFFKKGARTNSIKLVAKRIDLQELDIYLRLEIEKQIKELNLPKYKNWSSLPKDIQ